MVDDKRSFIVAKTVLVLVKIMERRLLLREMPSLQPLAAALLELKAEATADEFTRILDLLLSKLESSQRGVSTVDLQSRDAREQLLRFQAGMKCLQALGFERGNDSTMRLYNPPKDNRHITLLLNDIREPLQSPLDFVPLSENHRWISPGHECSFNVVEPARGDIVLMNGTCSVTWLKNPESDVDLVRTEAGYTVAC
jgi:hypothetical protein